MIWKKLISSLKILDLILIFLVTLNFKKKLNNQKTLMENYTISLEISMFMQMMKAWHIFVRKKEFS